MGQIRSFLFVPGDSSKKLQKALECPADALILDLEDAVAPSKKSIARSMTAEFLASHPIAERKSELWVRINALQTSEALTDLCAVVGSRPNGIMLPKADGVTHAEKLALYLDALEAQAGVELGGTRILPVATETATAPFHLGSYSAVRLPRLFGLTWGAEDLSAAIGASTNLNGQGQWAFTYQMVRSLMLLGAHAAGVQAIETLYVDFKDPAGLAASCRAARSEGFSGRIAIHPAQVEIINETFSPSSEEVAFARRVITAFAAEPEAGTVGLDGKMLDAPHLTSARRIIALAERAGQGL